MGNEEDSSRMHAIETRLSALEHRQSKLEAFYLTQQAALSQFEKVLLSISDKVDLILETLDNENEKTSPSNPSGNSSP